MIIINFEYMSSIFSDKYKLIYLIISIKFIVYNIFIRPFDLIIDQLFFYQ